MKKYLLFFIYLMAAPYAGAWGLLPSMPDGTSLLYRYLGQKNVVQPVCVRTGINMEGKTEYMQGLPNNNRVTEASLVTLEERALNYWFSNVRKAIVNSGRSVEFSDFLSIWPEHITLKYQKSCEGPHMLILNYIPYHWYVKMVNVDGRKQIEHVRNPIRVDYGEPLALATARTTQEAAYININERIDYIGDLLFNTLTHESGHLLGLADQYGYARFTNWETNIHPYFSYINVANSTDSGWTGRMRSHNVISIFGEERHSLWKESEIFPDDLDGAINAADFVQVYERGQVSPRVSSGWKSFSLAHKNIYYAYSMLFEYKGDPAQVVVPDALLARVQSYQDKVGQINVQDIRKMERLYKEVKNYQNKLIAKMGELKQNPGIEVPSNKNSLAEFSDDELKRLMALATVRYYDRRLTELSGEVIYSFEKLHYETTTYHSGDYQKDLDNNTAWISREIDGKRYFAYEPQHMTRIFNSVESYKRMFADFPQADKVVQEELKKTETNYVMREQTVKHCAVCGKEFSADEDPTMFYVNNPRRYYFACPEHAKQAPARTSKFLFRTAEQAHGKVVNITYEMAEQELKSRQTKKQLSQDLESADLASLKSMGVKKKPANSSDSDGGSSEEADGGLAYPTQPKTVKPVAATPSQQGGNVSSLRVKTTPATATAPAQPVVAGSNAGNSTKPIVTLTKPESAGVVPDRTVPSIKSPLQPVLAKTDLAAPVSGTKKPQGEAEPVSTTRKPEPVAQAPVVCEICGSSIKESHYYKTGEQKGVHNHSKCAYDYFIRHHAVDDKALASYETTYFLRVPADVSAARELMRNLDLTMADLRRYRSQARFANSAGQKPNTPKPVNPQSSWVLSERTKFFHAVAAFQRNALEGKKDENGVIEGTYPLMDSYFNSRKKQAYMTTMEWYASLDSVLASGSRYGTISDYLRRVLNGKVDKHIEQRYTGDVLQFRRRELDADKKAYKEYAPVVLQIKSLRAKVARLQPLPEVAKATVKRDSLTQEQVRQVEYLIELFKPLAAEINKVENPYVLQQIAKGLKADPFITKNVQYIQLGAFLAQYGYYTHVAAEGRWITDIGLKLQQLSK